MSITIIQAISVAAFIYFAHRLINPKTSDAEQSAAQITQDKESAKQKLLNRFYASTGLPTVDEELRLRKKTYKDYDTLISNQQKEILDKINTATKEAADQIKADSILKSGMNAEANSTKSEKTDWNCEIKSVADVDDVYGFVKAVNRNICSTYASTSNKEGSHIVWRNSKGQIHRLDGPAFIYRNGREEWYWEGRRTPAPASITSDTLMWKHNGVPHRDHGPAIVDFKNDSLTWYFDSKPHRDTGPARTAISNSLKNNEWYWNGHKTPEPQLVKEANPQKPYRRILFWVNDDSIVHREHGPAIITTLNDGHPKYEFFKDGLEYKNDAAEVIPSAGIRQFRPPYEPPLRMSQTGSRYWKDGFKGYHRLCGPAIIFFDGEERWYWEGERTTNPVREDNRLVWKDDDDQIHRKYGPAVVYPNGAREYWQHGQKQTSYGLYESPLDPIKHDEQIEISLNCYHYYKKGNRHRLNGPAVIDSYTKWYWKGKQCCDPTDCAPAEAKDGAIWNYFWKTSSGDFHRSDGGPALVCHYEDGLYLAWWVYGQKHRSDGPAIINQDNSIAFYYHGKEKTLDEMIELFPDQKEELLKYQGLSISV